MRQEVIVEVDADADVEVEVAGERALTDTGRSPEGRETAGSEERGERDSRRPSEGAVRAGAGRAEVL